MSDERVCSHCNLPDSVCEKVSNLMGDKAELEIELEDINEKINKLTGGRRYRQI